MHKIILLITILVFTSCALNNQGSSSRSRYSDDVEGSFSDIENASKDRKAALERYRLMRLKSIKSKSRRTSRRKKRSYNPRKKTSRKKVARKKSSKKKRSAPKKVTLDKDTTIEVEQKITYFCMQKRKSSRFRKSGSCESYTQNSLNSCKKKHTRGGRRLIRCLDRKLR